MKKHNHIFQFILSLFLMLAAFFVVNQHGAVAYAAGSDRIYYFNMDDNGLEGSMMLVESNGHWGLVDAGHTKAASVQDKNRVYYSTTVNGLSSQVYCRNGKDVANYMINQLGVTHLDFIVGTHAHSDHVGGIPDVASTSYKDSSGRTRYLVDSNTTYYYKEYQHISDLEDDLVRYSSNSWHNQAFAYEAKTAMANRGANLVELSKAQVIHGDPGNTYGDYVTFTVGNMSFRLYNVYEQTNTGNENVNSIVTVMTNGNYTVVNLADINTGNSAIDKTSQAIAKDFGSVDVVVAGHHGYAGSNTKTMFDSLQPSFVVIPNGMESSWLYTDCDLAAAIPYAQGKFGTLFYNLSISQYAVVTDLSGRQVYVYTVNGSGNLTDAINKMMKSANKTGWVSWVQSNGTLWSYLKNGKSVKNEWINTDGKWYFLDETGIMKTGWLTRGGQTYYLFSDTGAAATGWQLLNGKWYYFDPVNANMKTGWLFVKGKTYLLSDSGVMRTGWVTRGGSTYYFFSDTGYAATGWQQFGGKWYYFDPKGADMKTGWLYLNGKTYLLNNSGVMQTGWVNRGGSTYYFKPGSGEMASGWNRIDGKLYYFQPGQGNLATPSGWQFIDGKTYLFNEKGEMRTGWVTRGGSTYYFFSDAGYAATGWQQLGGKWYYFDPKGADMKTGWQQIGGKWYLFSDAGVMQTGWVTRGGQTYYLFSTGEMATGWQRLNGKLYYFQPGQGNLATPSGWQFIDGKTYLFNEKGEMRTGWVTRGGSTYYFFSDAGYAATGWQQLSGKWYYFDPNGAAMKTGWLFLNGKTYLLNDSGVMQTGWVNRGGSTYYFFSDTGEAAIGWQQLGGKWYYFDPNGANMRTGWQQISGKWYYLDPGDGHMLQNTTVDGYYINSEGVWVS